MPASTASRTSSKRLRYGADACRLNASNSARICVLTVSIDNFVESHEAESASLTA